jgi:hypothetical protein
MAVTTFLAWVVLLPAADPVSKGDEGLRGEWTAVTCETSDGTPAEVRAYAGRIRETIKAGKAGARFDAGRFTLALWERAEEMSGRYEYDGSRKPGRITLVTGWREHPQTPCLVRVEGDTLTLAWRPGQLFRFPDSLDPAGKSDVVQVKFKRKK